MASAVTPNPAEEGTADKRTSRHPVGFAAGPPPLTLNVRTHGGVLEHIRERFEVQTL
jgi:hypothetical protein